MKTRTIRRTRVVLTLTLIGIAFLAAEAQALQFPTGEKYFCRYRLPNGTEDTATVTFVGLAGNNYLRRGRMVTEYPRQGWPALDQPVTVTKPEILIPERPVFTRFELTLNHPALQCKDFWVAERSAGFLYFGCDNGVQQVCRRRGDPGPVERPQIDGVP